MNNLRIIGNSSDFADILSRFATNVPQTIDCGTGWAHLVRECHDAIMEIDPEYRVFQIKQKFGGLRFYFTPSDMDEHYLRLCSVVFPIEEKSFSTCETCGQDGYGRRTDGGYYYTSCDECATGIE